MTTRGSPSFIETLPRRGYRFIAQVNSMAAIEPVAPQPAPASETGLPPAPLPMPRRRISPVWIGGAVALVAAVALGLLYVRSRQAASGIGSIAVLPFENLTGDAAQSYFADAVTDAVTTHLAQVRGLEVVSRTSAKLSKQPDTRISAIASALQVDAVLEGTVARSGNQVRITAQLVRGATERHVWARSYDGEVSAHLLAPATDRRRDRGGGRSSTGRAAAQRQRRARCRSRGVRLVSQGHDGKRPAAL